jgi:large subunit ribosomal protein L33
MLAGFQHVFLYICTPNSVKHSKMAKKGNRIQVILECTEHKASGMPGTSRYITTKNKKNTTERVELKKYNAVLKKMTLHKEIK